MLSQTQKEKIIKKLTEKEVNQLCPRCKFTDFTILDGIFNQTLQDDVKNIKIGGPSIPTVLTACLRCGFISQHSLGVLGLMDIMEEK